MSTIVLTPTQVLLIKLAISVLPPVIAWLGLGFPTTRNDLGILGAAIGGAVLSGLSGLIGTKLSKRIKRKQIV